MQSGLIESIDGEYIPRNGRIEGRFHPSGDKEGSSFEFLLGIPKNSRITWKKFNLGEQDVILALDYTDYDFYGDVQGFWIHGWKGEKAVVGKFKFLIYAIVSSNIHQKVPLISIPIHLGHNMAKEMCFCHSLVQHRVKSIKLILFDRRFYSKELILTLANAHCPYLIFVPKNETVKKELAEMEDAERKKIHYEP